MKKFILTPSIFYLFVAILTGCSNGADQKDANSKTLKETSQKEPEKIEETKSVSEEQAVSEVKKFITENKKKFSKYGSLVKVKPSKGDYDGDGLDDFFYTTFFHEEGTEFDQAIYFYRDSKSNKISNLSFDKNNKSILSSEVSNIQVLSIKKNLIEAKYNIIHLFVGEERNFKFKFTINHNSIKLSQKDINKSNTLYQELDDLFNQDADGMIYPEEYTPHPDDYYNGQ
jgi:hypothetical protein